MKKVYVCLPYSYNPEESKARCLDACMNLFSEDVLPIAPQIYLGEFIDEKTNRRGAMRACLELLSICDEVRVFGTVMSPGMMQEIEHAHRNGIPVKFEQLKMGVEHE